MQHDLLLVKNQASSGTQYSEKLVNVTKGFLITGNASQDPVSLAVGNNNEVLVADSAQASGLKYAGIFATLVAASAIITSITLAGASDSNLASALAVKTYVDNLVTLGISYRPPVDAAYNVGGSALGATTNTIDGQTVFLGFRAVVFASSTGAQVGKIYRATGSSGSWTWTIQQDNTGADAPGDGHTIWVKAGTAFGDTRWTYSGTTWVQSAAAGSYTSGDGISISGNTVAVSLVPSSPGLAFDSARLKVLLKTDGGLKVDADDNHNGVYLTANQSITLSGDVTGTGTTAITATIANNAVTLAKMATMATASFLGRNTASTGNVEVLSVATVKTMLGLGSAAYTDTTAYATAGHLHAGVYQPLDADLTAIAGLAGTTGFLKKTAADTWSLDTSTYLTANQSITLSGDVTGTGTTAITATIANNAVTLAKMATMATASFLGRNTASTGNVEVLSVATVQTMLGLGTAAYTASTAYAAAAHNHTLANITDVAISSVANNQLLKYNNSTSKWENWTPNYLTANQTITLSGDLSGSGTTSISATIGNNAVTLAKMAQMATASFLGRNTASTGNVEVLSVATVQTMLGLGTAAYTASTAYAAAAHNHDGSYQPLDADLSAIAALAGTSGILKKTAADTWALDTGTFVEYVSVPASQAAAGTPGDLAYEASTGYMYLCIANNDWRRAAFARY
jgi:hypothetical protein